MKITKELLKSHHACEEGMEWVTKSGLIGKDHEDFIAALMKGDHFDYANWLIVRLMTNEQKIMYAIFAAEQVLSIYEANHPGDDRPRKAIEAARSCLIDPSYDNKIAAYASASAAADASAKATVYAAASYAAYAASDASAKAKYAADASAKVESSIINHGLTLLK